MLWLSGLPIFEAQKIDGSAHKSQKTLFGGKYTAACRSSLLSFPVTISKDFSSNVLFPRLYPNWMCLWPHTLALLLLCHLPTTPMFSPSWQQWCWTEGSSRPAFYEGTFSNRWLRTGITLKPDGIFFKKISGNKLWAMWNTPEQFLDWKSFFLNFSHFQCCPLPLNNLSSYIFLFFNVHLLFHWQRKGVLAVHNTPLQRQALSNTRSAGSLAQCREKFGPRPIFKIFSLDQIRVDQEKKPFFFWSTRISSSEKINKFLKIGRGPNFSLHCARLPRWPWPCPTR